MGVDEREGGKCALLRVVIPCHAIVDAAFHHSVDLVVAHVGIHDGQEIARGLINYSSSEARRIAGHGTQDIEALLGYIDSAELIHRDNLILL